MRQSLLELLRGLRSEDDRLPVGDLRDLLAEVLGLVGVATLLMVVIGLLAVPTSSPVATVVAVVFGLAPLALRWLVQRTSVSITVPGLLLGSAALALLWVLAVGSLQAVQSSLLLLPLMFASFIYGPRLGLIGACAVSAAAFWLAYSMPNPERVGSILPINQAWILTEFAFITVLCMIGLRRYVARAHRQAVVVGVRRREDEALLLLTQRLRMAVEAGQCGVWEFDVQTQTFTIDAQQARLYGVSDHIREVGFTQWQRSVHHDDLTRATAEFLAVIQADRPYDLTFRIRRADGAVRWLRSLGQARRDEAGRVRYVVGLDRDVTEQEEGARALRKAGSPGTSARPPCTACPPRPARSGRRSGRSGSPKRIGRHSRQYSTAAPSVWSGRSCRRPAKSWSGGCAPWRRRFAVRRARPCCVWARASTSRPNGRLSVPSNALVPRPSSRAVPRAPSWPT